MSQEGVVPRALPAQRWKPRLDGAPEFNDLLALMIPITARLSGILPGFAALWLAGLAGAAEPTPLARAHAHNDYEHVRPLLDALGEGFCSVEADIHLVEGALLVAHDASQVRLDRTLESLYLEPLRQRVRANGGRVHRDGPSCWLLIDVKSDGASTWQVLRPLLERYREMLTTSSVDKTETNAVTVVLSGNATSALLANQTTRLAALDGRVADLQTNPSPHLVPLISASWGSQFRWRGQGPMPADEATRLRDLVAKAHGQGRRLRFWGGPDLESRWRVEWDAGVDFINTDRLKELGAFLRHPVPRGDSP